MTLLSIKISQKYEVTGEQSPDIQVHELYHDTICIQIEEKTSSGKQAHFVHIGTFDTKYSHTKEL